MPGCFCLVEVDVHANLSKKDSSNDEVVIAPPLVDNAFDSFAFLSCRQLRKHDIMKVDMLGASTWAIACVHDDGSHKVEQLSILQKRVASDDVVGRS